MLRSLVGSEMCIRDSFSTEGGATDASAHASKEGLETEESDVEAPASAPTSTSVLSKKRSAPDSFGPTTDEPVTTEEYLKTMKEMLLKKNRSDSVGKNSGTVTAGSQENPAKRTKGILDVCSKTKPPVGKKTSSSSHQTVLNPTGQGTSLDPSSIEREGKNAESGEEDL